MKKAGKWLFVVFCGSSILAAQWVEVNTGDYPLTLETTGVVESSDIIRFNPPAASRWQSQISFIAQEGQHVKQGDLLVRFESSYEDRRLREQYERVEVKRGELQATIQKHKQEVETEKLELAEAESTLDKAKRKAEQPENLIASTEYQKLIEERQLAEAIVKQLRKRLTISTNLRQKKIKELETSLSRYQVMADYRKSRLDTFTIHAPREGVVVIGNDYDGTKLDVNSSVNPGLVVMTLVDDTSFVVKSMIPEFKSAMIEVGQRTNMIAEVAGGIELKGVVSEVGRTVRRKSFRTEEMIRDFTVELDEQPDSLKLGMSVKVIVELGMSEDVIAIPRNIVSYREGRPGVESRSGWISVELGATSLDKVIVEEGLSKGQEILY